MPSPAFSKGNLVFSTFTADQIGDQEEMNNVTPKSSRTAEQEADRVSQTRIFNAIKRTTWGRKPTEHLQQKNTLTSRGGSGYLISLRTFEASIPSKARVR